MFPPPPPPPAMSVNTCCVTCTSPCGFARRRRRDVSKAESSIFSTKGITDDPVCNNLKLKRIMEEVELNVITTCLAAL